MKRTRSIVPPLSTIDEPFCKKYEVSAGRGWTVQEVNRPGCRDLLPQDAAFGVELALELSRVKSHTILYCTEQYRHETSTCTIN